MHVIIIARSITLEACHMSMCLVLSFAGLVSVTVSVLCFGFGFVFAGGYSGLALPYPARAAADAARC